MHRRWLAFAFAAGGGCGRVHFDSTADAPPPPDLAPDARPLFGEPQLVRELIGMPTDNATDPSLTDDLREVYFVARAPGNNPGRLLRATRSSTTDPWTTPAVVMELESSGDEAGPQVIGDGLTIYVSSNRAGSLGAHDIYIATRPDRAGTWSTPAPIVELNTANDEPSPGVDAAQLNMVVNVVDAMTGSDLYMRARTTTADPWGPLVAIPGINTAGFDGTPMLDAAGTALYFSSDRDGTRDLYIAERLEPRAPFGPARPIAELNTTMFDDTDPWISPDGRVLFFESDRDGLPRIYFATR